MEQSFDSVFMYFFKSYTIDKLYCHNFFAIASIKIHLCQITYIKIIIIVSLNFEKIIFKIAEARPGTSYYCILVAGNSS